MMNLMNHFWSARRPVSRIRRTRGRHGVAFLLLGLMAVPTLGAVAIFTPQGPTTVTPGSDVVFQVTVIAQFLGDFDAADIVIQSSDATDLSFAYSPQWNAAFANVTLPALDVLPPGQDVLVGGNNPTPVGINLVLGTVTVTTGGMSEGTFVVRIEPDVAPGVSSLTLKGMHEPLSGMTTFTIQCATADTQCDGDVDFVDYAAFPDCLGGPDVPVNGCGVFFDADGDGDVDLNDWGSFIVQFTGPF